MSTPKALLKPLSAFLISPAAEDHKIFGDLFRPQG